MASARFDLQLSPIIWGPSTFLTSPNVVSTPEVEKIIYISKGFGKLNEIIDGNILGKGPEPTEGIQGAVIPNVWFHLVTFPKSPFTEVTSDCCPPFLADSLRF